MRPRTAHILLTSAPAECYVRAIICNATSSTRILSSGPSLVAQVRAIRQLAFDRFAKVSMSFATFRKSFTWADLRQGVSAFVSVTVRLLWAVPGILIVILVAQNISGDLVTIEPISVPKHFSENGYTPEVTSHRLRDALADFANKANTSMQGPNIALRGEFEKIVRAQH